MASLSLKIPQITLFPHDFARQKEKMMDFPHTSQIILRQNLLRGAGKPRTSKVIEQ